MTEPMEFEVPDPGAPNLGDGAGEQAQGQDPSADAAALAAVVPGWTQAEAARVIGGLVAGITTAMYVLKHHAPPAVELVPAIAGDPEREFPLLGMSLAPILDAVAPKGSAAAVGVGLGAGVSELMTAMARRMPVLAVAPQQKAMGAPAPAAAAQPRQAPAGDGGGFKFSGDALRVLRNQEQPLIGMGIE